MSNPPHTNEVNRRVARFLMAYGDFLTFWSTFEITVEILVMRQLETDAERTSIVCGGLAMGAKMAILNSLLNRTNNTEGVALLKQAQALAERNGFAHGFFLVSHKTGTFELIRREVKDFYRARIKPLDDDLMLKHSAQFTEKVNEVQTHFSVSDADLRDYTKQIEGHASAHASQDKRRPAPPTSSSKAKKK